MNITHLNKDEKIKFRNILNDLLIYSDKPDNNMKKMIVQLSWLDWLRELENVNKQIDVHIDDIKEIAETRYLKD